MNAMNKDFYWLSFVDPLNKEFQGVAIVEALDEFDAEDKTYSLGIHPGGIAQYIKVPKNQIDRCVHLKDRLIGLKELSENFDDLIGA